MSYGVATVKAPDGVKLIARHDAGGHLVVYVKIEDRRKGKRQPDAMEREIRLIRLTATPSNRPTAAHHL